MDGVRTLAVLPVVFYHYKLAFPGGYAGVDVFFVEEKSPSLLIQTMLMTSSLEGPLPGLLSCTVELPSTGIQRDKLG